jgi:hypothetical protein
VQVVTPKGVPKVLGPYRIEGAMVWDDERKVLLGHDPGLDRPVWIALRGHSDPAPSTGRLALNRLSRQRWISGGSTEQFRWDAFTATEGCLLADLVVFEGSKSGHLKQGRRGLVWPTAYPILDELARELAAACEDGALPPDLTPDHVWIAQTGQVQLLDAPIGAIDPVHRRLARHGTPDERALDLLRDVAILMLEGQRRPADAPRQPIRARVTRTVRRVLNRLLGVSEPYRTVVEFRTALEATRT